MAHKPYKFKVLLGENLPDHKSFPRLNGRYDIKHVVHDFCKQGITDNEVMNLGDKTGRIIITLNEKHFCGFKLKKTNGVIGISQNLSKEQIDSKITSFLSKSNRSQIYGHHHYITQKTIETTG